MSSDKVKCIDYLFLFIKFYSKLEHFYCQFMFGIFTQIKIEVLELV